MQQRLELTAAAFWCSERQCAGGPGNFAKSLARLENRRMSTPGCMQVTLVSHYGKKEQAFVELISHLQAHLERCLPDAFSLYRLDQVHGTIAGSH